jgi:hypothetical protein
MISTIQPAASNKIDGLEVKPDDLSNRSREISERVRLLNQRAVWTSKLISMFSCLSCFNKTPSRLNHHPVRQNISTEATVIDSERQQYEASSSRI